MYTCTKVCHRFDTIKPLKSVCILNNIYTVQCTVDYTTFAVSGKVGTL